MKNVLFFGLLTFIVVACTQNNPTTQTLTTEKQPVVAAPQIDSNSTYLIDDFLVAVAKTKSPYIVSKTADYPVFGFSFTPTQFRGYGVHEGGDDTELTFDKNTKNYMSKSMPGLDAFELKVAVDGSVQLTFPKSGKTYTYHKVPDVDSALRAVLFAGNYTDAKTKTTIRFQADGTLTGLGTEKTYQPIYDYMGGPLDFDEVVMREKADDTKESYYHYKFKGTTLELYEAIQPKNGDGVEKIGSLKYTLVKG